MDALTTTEILIPSFLGAIGQEILHWYGLSKELGKDVKLHKSTSY